MKTRLSVIDQPVRRARLVFLALVLLALVLLGYIWLQSALAFERAEESAQLEAQNARLRIALAQERQVDGSVPSSSELERLRERILKYNALAPETGLSPTQVLDVLEASLRSDTRLSELYFSRKDQVLSVSLASEAEASLLLVLEALQEGFEPNAVQLERQLTLDGRSAQLVQFDIKVDMR